MELIAATLAGDRRKRPQIVDRTTDEYQVLDLKEYITYCILDQDFRRLRGLSPNPDEVRALERADRRDNSVMFSGHASSCSFSRARQGGSCGVEHHICRAARTTGIQPRRAQGYLSGADRMDAPAGREQDLSDLAPVEAGLKGHAESGGFGCGIIPR